MTKTEFDLYCAKHLTWKSENAARRGIKFELSFQSMKNLLKAKRCYYTGVPLTKSNGSGEMRPTDATIDRIDCTLGYEKGNVVACCHAANQVKSQFEKAGIQGLRIGAQVFTKAIKRMEAQS